MRAARRRSCRWEATHDKLAHKRKSSSVRWSPLHRRRSASARRCCSSEAEAQGRSVEGPDLRGRSAVAEAAAQPLAARLDDRRLGRRAGQRLDHPSRRRRPAQQRARRGAQSADRRVLPPAPPVLVFDPEGNLVRSWGGPGPGYEWPESNHGIHVDYKGNVWIGGNGEKDAHILKFTKDGKFLMQVGQLRQERPAATIRRISAASPRSGSIRRPTKPMSPTAIATSASRCSTPTPAR